MDKTWAELTPEQQTKIAKGAADFLGEEGEPHWIAMGQGSRESWLWNDEHPTEARGAYEAELRRIADRADPATNGAFGQIVSYPPAPPPVDLFAEDDPKTDIAYVRLRDRIMTPEAVKALPEPEWLIHGLLVKNTLALLWGPWNAGKTFLSLAWAGFVGSGSWWLGREVVKTKVLYVAGEGVAGLGNRIRAFEHGHHLFGMPGVDFHHGRINLLDPGEMVALRGRHRGRLRADRLGHPGPDAARRRRELDPGNERRRGRSRRAAVHHRLRLTGVAPRDQGRDVGPGCLAVSGGSDTGTQATG